MIAASLASAGVQRPDALTAFAEANAAAERGELEHATAEFVALRELEPGHAIAAYSLACLAARRGERAQALEWLGRAVDEGWDDSAVAEWDVDLASLRGQAGFRALVDRMRAHAAAIAVATEWTLDVPRRAEPAHGDVQRAAVDSDGVTLVLPGFTGSAPGTLEGIDLRTGRRTTVWTGVPGGETEVQVGSVGVLLTVTSRGADRMREEIRLWSNKGGAALRSWSATYCSRTSLRPDGTRALIDRELVDCASGDVVQGLPAELGQVSRLAWSSDSRTLAVGTRDGAVQLFDGDTLAPRGKRWKLADETRGRSVSALEFDPRGRHLAVALWNGWNDRETTGSPTVPAAGPHRRAGEDIALVDTSDGHVLGWLDEIGLWPNSNVSGLKHSPDGCWLVASDQGDLCCFDVEKRVRTWNWISDFGGNGLSGWFTFAPDGRTVAVWGRPVAERLFELAGGDHVGIASAPPWISESDTAAAKTTWCASGKLDALVGCTGAFASVVDARTLAVRYVRLRLDDGAEVVQLPCGYVDGTLEGLRSASMCARGADSRPVAELARFVWDPKRVRAALAGVRVLPPLIPH